MNKSAHNKITHRIRVQSVEVEFENPEDAFKTRDELSEVCRNRLIPAMEKLLDRKYAAGPPISIPNLVIDAGILDAGNWENALIDAVLLRMERFFDKEGAGKEQQPDRSRPVEKQGTTNEEHKRRASFILAYLKSGVQPWNSSYESKEQLKSDLLHLLKASGRFLKSVKFLAPPPLPWNRQGREIMDLRDDFTRELLKLLASDMNAMKRLLYLVPEKEVLPVLVKKSWNRRELRKIRKNWNAIFQLAGLPEPEHAPVFLQALSVLHERRKSRSLTFSEDISQEVVRVLEVWHKPIFKKLPEVLEKYLLFPGKQVLDFRKDTSPVPRRNTHSAQLTEETVYITNAGLVLLHPFLHNLFENTGHTVNKAWDSQELQQRSIVLSQYLITGEEVYAEHELFLNKVLTGYPVEAALPLDTLLSDFEKKEAGELLESVIDHWKALQHTGIPALRETFLLRPGKLTRRNSGWLLEVDQQVPDVLLGKIPWGFSTIKTPWMQEILTVEWA